MTTGIYDRKTAAPNSGIFKKGHEGFKPSWTGKKMPLAQRLKLKKPKLGGALRKWFGTVREYKTLHAWVNRNFGRPTKCEHCPFTSSAPRKLHWANRTGKYLRDRSDWIRLCYPCHKKYDRTT